VIKGCPMRVTWGKPKQLDTMDRDQRIAHAKEGRAMARAGARGGGQLAAGSSRGAIAAPPENDLDKLAAMAPPPGADDDDAQYPSLAGN